MDEIKNIDRREERQKEKTQGIKVKGAEVIRCTAL